MEVEENIIQFSSQHVVAQLSLRSHGQVNINNSPRNSKCTAHLTSEQDNGVMGTGGGDGPRSVSSDRAEQLSLYRTTGFAPKSCFGMWWGNQ